MKPQARDAIDLKAAQTLVIGKVDVLAPEEICLEDAVGRVLRGQVVSDVDYPSEDVSAMDGYALAASSTEGASRARPVALRPVGSVKAGETPSVRIGPGECAAITTGAVLPQGSDAVAKSEDVANGQGVVILDRPVARSAFVRMRGEVLARGTRLDVDGWRVTPATAGLLAAVGAGRVAAARRLRVGVLTTGDEIVPYDTFPSPGRFRNSNGPMLAGLAAAIGCEVVAARISGDSIEDLVRNLEAYSDCDTVLVSGGISGGEFDLVPQALRTLGAEIYFDAVRMSPGKRVVFARRGRTAFFGVPGNPGAALVVFMMIARPGLLKMMGVREVLPALLKARTTAEIDKAKGLVKLVPGFLRRSGLVEPLRSRGTGDVIALARADCLVYLGPDRGSVAARETVDVLML
jgi:molybdopterin molybdotransferase